MPVVVDLTLAPLFLEASLTARAALTLCPLHFSTFCSPSFTDTLLGACPRHQLWSGWRCWLVSWRRPTGPHARDNLLLHRLAPCGRVVCEHEQALPTRHHLRLRIPPLQAACRDLRAKRRGKGHAASEASGAFLAASSHRIPSYSSWPPRIPNSSQPIRPHLSIPCQSFSFVPPCCHTLPSPQANRNRDLLDRRTSLMSLASPSATPRGALVRERRYALIN